MADYLGIWDTDEFFIPKGKNKNLLDVVNSASTPPNEPLDPLFSENSTFEGWKGGRGWADKEGHQFCYLRLQ
jgi:hypothetical protein